MPKAWDLLEPSAKIEELRADMLRIYEAINSTNRDVMNLSSHVNEIGVAVKKLESLADHASKRKAE